MNEIMKVEAEIKAGSAKNEHSNERKTRIKRKFE